LIPTTTSTPMATPMMVSAARTLLLRRASRAIPTPSKISAILSLMRTPSLLPQCGYRVQPRRAARRVPTCSHADAGADQERECDGPRCHVRRQWRHHGYDARDCETEPDPDRSAYQAECRRLHEKLPADIASTGAKRLPHADLARALRHGNQHDVHDDQRADHEADRGERHAEHLKPSLQL